MEILNFSRINENMMQESLSGLNFDEVRIFGLFSMTILFWLNFSQHTPTIFFVFLVIQTSIRDSERGFVLSVFWREKLLLTSGLLLFFSVLFLRLFSPPKPSLLRQLIPIIFLEFHRFKELFLSFTMHDFEASCIILVSHLLFGPGYSSDNSGDGPKRSLKGVFSVFALLPKKLPRVESAKVQTAEEMYGEPQYALKGDLGAVSVDLTWVENSRRSEVDPGGPTPLLGGPKTSVTLFDEILSEASQDSSESPQVFLRAPTPISDGHP
jgi:hypothetical protein